MFRKDGFVVCIYCERGGQHHLPHCHVRWADREAVVSITTARLIVGDAIPAGAIQVLVENVDLLVKRWEELNGSAEQRSAIKPLGGKRLKT